MDITEITILHHSAIVLLGLWLLSAFNWCHPVAYFVAFIYLYLVHERYVTRLRRKLQFEERKQANQRRGKRVKTHEGEKSKELCYADLKKTLSAFLNRHTESDTKRMRQVEVLSDSESVRWLNHAIENIWLICMEQITSQKILLPIIPWFLEKYKPWTAKKAVVQHLYLGRNPPLFTEMRVLRQNGDDHLVLELGMNFLTADDMSAIIAVKLRKRLGFGMRAKLHITGMHVEGKVLVGVKFRQTWPFLSRLRVCFVEPPYFQMTVKPIFTHGLDVTEVPGIAGWLDKLLSIAFEQTLVEPNMLVVDVEKFASPQPEPWFSINEKEPVAYAHVEVVEGSDMKPSDLNGLADPYVKGHLGGYRFRTNIQRKTLAPKWLEEFKIPIITWECANVLAIEVCDKDHFYDDNLGNCSVNLCDLRDGQRHDMWLPLQNIKTGRLHLAITILEDNSKEVDKTCNEEAMDAEQERNSFANETYNKNSFSSVSSEKSQKVADNYEPIDVEGQNETGIWVHQPGSEVSQTWEPRKGRSRRLDTEIHREPNDLCGSFNSAASGSLNNDCSSPDDNPEHKHRIKSVWKGLHNIWPVFRRGPKNEPPTPTSARGVGEAEAVPSPHANIKPENAKEIGVRFVMEDNISGLASGKVQMEGTSPESNSSESPGNGNAKDKAKNMLKHAAGKSARGLKHVLSYKSRKSEVDSLRETTRVSEESDSSDDDDSLSVPSPRDGRIPVASKVIVSFNNDPSNSSENVVVQTHLPDVTLGDEVPTKKLGVEEEPALHGSPDKSSKDYVDTKHGCPDKSSEGYVETKHDRVSGGMEQI